MSMTDEEERKYFNTVVGYMIGSSRTSRDCVCRDLKQARNESMKIMMAGARNCGVMDIHTEEQYQRYIHVHNFRELKKK